MSSCTMVSSTSCDEWRRLAQKTIVGGGAEKKARALPSGPMEIKLKSRPFFLFLLKSYIYPQMIHTVVSTVETHKVDGSRCTLVFSLLLGQKLRKELVNSTCPSTKRDQSTRLPCWWCPQWAANDVAGAPGERRLHTRTAPYLLPLKACRSGSRGLAWRPH